jgi:glycosyltransferase involved in cell wall biosynthesis
VIAVPTSESVSAIVLESLACEIPVISTKVNKYNHELLPEAWCVHLNDSIEISDAIMSIFRGSRYVHGRAMVHDSFEQEDVMRLLLSSYEKEIPSCA